MSDYSPPYTDEDARDDARRARVVARIKKLNVDDMTIGEWLQLLDIFRGVKYDHLESNINMHDVARLEKFLKRKTK